MNRIYLVFFVLVVVASQSAYAGPRLQGIGGYWFDAQQPGFGMAVTVARPGLAVVTWTAFDLDGRSTALYSEATIAGNRIVGDVLRPSGGPFGNFDGSAPMLEQWGSLEIEFLDCFNARVRWTADLPGFPDGETSLERLAFASGLGCNALPDLPVGLYSGVTRDSFRSDRRALGYMDSQRRLWSLTAADTNFTGFPDHNWAVTTPPDAAFGPIWATVLDASGSSSAGTLDIDGIADWATFITQRPHEPVFGSWNLGGFAEGSVEWSWISGSGVETVQQNWSSTPLPGFSLIEVRSIEVVSGNFWVPTFRLAGDVLDRGRLNIQADGSACFEQTAFPQPNENCTHTGEFRMSDSGDPGLMEFEMRRVDDPSETFTGRAWYVQTDQGGRLFLVGIGDDRTGMFALTAQRREVEVSTN